MSERANVTFRSKSKKHNKSLKVGGGSVPDRSVFRKGYGRRR